MSSAGRDALVAMLSRLKNDLQRASRSKPDQAHDALTAKYPLSSDYVVEVRRLCERGIEDGWLVQQPEEGNSSFSRVAPQSSWFPFSIEAGLIKGASATHQTPKGEIGLCWPMDGKPKFCGSDPGWVVFAPGKHQPKVTGGTMFMLSFLPDGAIERKAAATKRRSSTARKTASSAASRTRTTKRKTTAKRTATAKSPARKTASGGRS